MEPLFISALLLALSLGILVLELFLPSGGVLGIMAGIAALGAIFFGFRAGLTEGIVVVIIVGSGIPVAGYLGLKYWPKTPLGRAIVSRPEPDDEQLLPDMDGLRDLKTLVGQRGVAKTKLLPSGIVTVGGRALDAVSEGMAIEPGDPVCVTAIRMRRVVVRPDDGAETGPSVADEAVAPETAATDPAYDQPVEDPFQDPLA